MSAGHSHPLYVDRASAVHRLAPEAKIVVTVLFTVVVVVTPREEFVAFAGYALLLAAATALARVSPLWLAKRATIELPFVLLALALPFAGHGQRVTWLGMSLSVDGLYGAWNIFVKGTLGVLASLLLAGTTTTVDLIRGLDKLHCPRVLTQIATFMLRYLYVLVGEARQMRIARLSRGYDPRFLWQVRAFAVGVGALFLRAFERGERVYLAMLARGYSGRLPPAGRKNGGVVAARKAGDVGATPALEVLGLHYAYPDGRVALQGVDLTIAAGERVALLGPNGAGKTTLVLHLNGILAGGGGVVRVGGLVVDPSDRASLAEVRRRVGIVFQDPDDQLFMPTVAEDVAFGPANLGLRGTELRARVDEALAAVGMLKFRDRTPHHLSFGQRRRVAVATVLAMRPQILVLDEPSSNLDPASRRELSQIVRGLPVTVLMVTHDLPYALELCARSVILDRGRPMADGPTVDILNDTALLARHRLELPFGFDPCLAAAQMGFAC